MPTTQHDEPYIKILAFSAIASWHWDDVPPSTDPAATAFGPYSADFSNVGTSVVALPSPSAIKPVLYIPVKRLGGQETFPTLRVHLTLAEAGELRNVSVPAHQRAQVEINVWNVWGNARVGPAKLQGQLDAKGECAILVAPENVKTWLDPKAELGGRVNELLLDFDFTLPTLKVKGQPLQGESRTRVYLYRRKVIVFLPGVFGSQVRVKTPDGRTLGFPDFFQEPADVAPDQEPLVADEYARAPQLLRVADQEVGALECDAAGRALLQPIQPTLLRLKGKVYDIYDDCRSARLRYFGGVPEDFRLIELRLFAYDWRTDLTESAKALTVKLAELQSQLRALCDTDDEIALAGHSTGGLIIRRALGEPGMPAKVSHAFFISVPFLGAPKALSVILTGQDPPGGERMIPIITADSLRDGALSMPIVYHLTPTADYPGRVAFTPTRAAGAQPAIEDDKRELVETAIAAGFRPRPRFIKASGASDADRAQLAAGADDWHRLWAVASERMRAQELYDAMYPRGDADRDAWLPRQIKSRRLETQYAARVPGGWNVELAARAAQFHSESQEIFKSGAWDDKAYVFYSVDKLPTTLSVHLERVSEADFAGPLDLLNDEGIPTLRFLGGDVKPPRGEETQTLDGGLTVPALVAHQWTRVNGRCRKVVWRVWGECQKYAGDQTVPLRSLLEFGGRTARFAMLPEDSHHKAHAATPKDASIWRAIMHALQGTWTSPPTTPSAELERPAKDK